MRKAGSDLFFIPELHAPISAHVLLLAVLVGVLAPPAIGNREFGPCTSKCDPIHDFKVYGPAKLESTNK